MVELTQRLLNSCIPEIVRVITFLNMIAPTNHIFLKRPFVHLGIEETHYIQLEKLRKSLKSCFLSVPSMRKDDLGRLAFQANPFCVYVCWFNSNILMIVFV